MSNPSAARVTLLDTLVDTFSQSGYQPSETFMDSLNRFEADTNAVFFHLPISAGDSDTVYFGLRDGSYPDLRETGDVSAILRVGHEYHLFLNDCKFVIGGGRSPQDLFDEVESAVRELSTQLGEKIPSEESQTFKTELARLATVITATLCAHWLRHQRELYTSPQVREMVDIVNKTLNSVEDHPGLKSDV